MPHLVTRSPVTPRVSHHHARPPNDLARMNTGTTTRGGFNSEQDNLCDSGSFGTSGHRETLKLRSSTPVTIP